jgi:outer membrane protein assembly factor BamB
VRRALFVGVVVSVVVAVAAVAYVAYVRYVGRDVRGSASVEFVPAAVPQVTHRVGRRRVDRGVTWSTYGYDAERLRFAPGIDLRPPYRRLWTFHGRNLLEFPPAIAYRRLYLPTFDGRFFALDSRTGRVVWRYRSDHCAWASPAVENGLVFQTFLLAGRTCTSGARPFGELVAFDARTGALRWRLRLASASESSPLATNGAVYVADWSGVVYAVAAKSGRVLWRSHVGGELKGSIARAGRLLYIGSYDGHLSALDARTGRVVWRSGLQPRLGHAGTIYSTPAVAYGRVYLGSTDGKLYSFGATSGRLRWSHSTGGYVYASPAVWDGLVLAGSYDHRFYALDAATGDERWSFPSNGRISGSATVIDGIVYFSTLSERTYALNARTGRLVWSYPDGKYSPVVADHRRLYLVGFGRLYGMSRARPR